MCSMRNLFSLCLDLLYPDFKTSMSWSEWIKGIDLTKMGMSDRLHLWRKLWQVIIHENFKVLLCIIARRGKTCGSDRVNRVASQNGLFLNKSIWVSGRVGLTCLFQTIFFFIIFFFNYKNKSMTTYLEKMNKIN